VDAIEVAALGRFPGDPFGDELVVGSRHGISLLAKKKGLGGQAEPNFYLYTTPAWDDKV
jgi:hypothetical protein